MLGVSLGLAIFLFFALESWQTATFREKPSVILLTVESLRRDQVNEDNTPHLLAAASDAIRLPNHRAVSGWTTANIVSLLTGLSPFVHGVHTRGQFVNPELNLPLEQLGAKGYAVTGLQPFMAMDLYSNMGLNIPVSNGDPRLWVAEQRQRGGPFFLWYHYVHTHLPYAADTTRHDRNTHISPTADPAQEQRLLRVRTQAAIHYDETTFTEADIPLIHRLQQQNIHQFDQWFQAFWHFFTSAGLRRNTILIVTADHGDEHGERGMTGHASTTLAGHLHREIVDLPFFIWLPPGLQKKNIAAPTHGTSHLDVLPTLFALLGLQPEAPFTGENIFARSGSDRGWFAMTSSGGFAEPDPEKIRYFEYAHADSRWKSLLRITREGEESFFLFDLASDPKELTNVADLFPEVAARNKTMLRELSADRVIRPVTALETAVASDTGPTAGPGPQWLRPAASGIVNYDSLGDSFRLEWRGDAAATYLLEYQAGSGPKAVSGTMKITGTSKDFGHIDRAYWLKWLVPLSPFRIRVGYPDGSGWSPWLELDARP